MPHTSTTPANESSREFRELFAAKSDDTFPPGARIGRFVLLDRLGAGAMGVVYAAYDPELARKVALKLVLARGDEPGSALRQRLFREAQALARLSNPNVVAVHDVYTHDDRVWIAMEYVAGQTLADWARQGRHAWTDTLRVLRDAAAGVAAAHAAGVIHRDLKPENVMLDHDGRVRVMDFGLAHGRHVAGGAAELEATDPSSPSDDPRRADTLAVRLTRSGATPGTPAYMAPEQWAGGEAGPAADQFAWSVMAWELLYGERPFAGENAAALTTNVRSGRRRPLPRGRRIPGWVRRIVERGLAVDPARRWPSMAALLAALNRGRVRSMVRTAAFVAIGAAATVAAVDGYRRWELAQRVSTCEAARADIDTVWNADKRQELRDALTATGINYAASSAERAIARIDRYAAEWGDAHVLACTSTYVDEQWDQDLHDRALWCLDDKHLGLDSLLEELRKTNATILPRVVSATTALLPIHACIDTDQLRRRPTPPTDRRPALREVRATLARSHSLGMLGSYKEALTLAVRAREQAEALDWLPLQAATQAWEGVVLDATGAFAEAEAASTKAYFAATRAAAWEIAADAAIDLLDTVGHELARPADGRTWARHAADVALPQSGDPDGLLEATRLRGLASLHFDAGEFTEAKALYTRVLVLRTAALGPDHLDVGASMSDVARTHAAMGSFKEAQELFEQALAIAQRTLGPDHPRIATSANNVATMLAYTGDLAGALERFERSSHLLERALGPDHPDVATSLNNLSATYFNTGEFSKAIALSERVLRIGEKTLGPDHPVVAERLTNLGAVYWASGDHRRAGPLHERALSIAEKTLGPNHPIVASILNNLAIVRKAEGEFTQARALYERSLAIMEKTLGPDHPDVASTLNNLAIIHEHLGEFTAERGMYRRSLEILRKTRGPDHPEIATNLFNLAAFELDRHKYRDAVPYLIEAAEILDRHAGVQEIEPKVNLHLARALVASGGDHDLAIAAATKARDQCRESSDEECVVQAEQWLKDSAAAHPAPRRARKPRG